MAHVGECFGDFCFGLIAWAEFDDGAGRNGVGFRGFAGIASDAFCLFDEYELAEFPQRNIIAIAEALDDEVECGVEDFGDIVLCEFAMSEAVGNFYD